MARHYSLNNTLATFSLNVYTFIANLISAGWTKVQDSDGTTYSASGTQVTGGGTGANGLGNASAWVYMKSPDGRVGFCLQRSVAADNQWRWTYSPKLLFIGGTPGATRVPTATDSITMLGGGTDAAPTYAAWFSGTAGSTRWNSVCNDAAPYDWWCNGWPVGGGVGIGGGFFDGVVNGFPSVDNDPHVINIDTAGFTSASVTGASRCFGNQPQVNAMSGMTGVPFAFVPPTGGLAPDPITGDDQLRVMEYYVGSGGYYKGQTISILWEMTGTAGAPRNLAQLLTRLATGDYILVGVLALPWQSGTTPLV